MTDRINDDRAAGLEQYLKERTGSMPYGGLIGDIRVRETDPGRSLEVTVLPKGEELVFGTVRIGPEGADSDRAWRKIKKRAFGQVKGLRPGLSPLFKERVLKEAGEALEAWREGHPFTEAMRAFLSSEAASSCFSGGRIALLGFLAGRQPLIPERAETGPESITVSFRSVPFKAVCDPASGRIRFSLREADRLYEKLEEAVRSEGTRDQIVAFLRDKGFEAGAVYAGRPDTFVLTFRFETGEETETVTVGRAWKRIVSAACRRAEERAADKKKEQEAYLKTCPAYGTFLARAVLDTVEDNGNHVTADQIVSLLRGTGLSDRFVFGRDTGKFNLLSKEEILEAVTALETFGAIRKKYVRGEYRNYYVYAPAGAGRLFANLQSTPRPGRVPATDQEFYYGMKASFEDTGKLSRQRKQALLRALAERPGIFLTDPDFVLDWAERMGKDAAEYLKPCLEREERRNRRTMLRLLLNAAAGKGKVPPKNGLSAFRERQEKKRRDQEAALLRDRELYRLVLTEIPERYADLYPAARSMKRHFVLHVGPTNSGKTHDALEALMQADTGIYLGPLRLLAFEMYEKMNRSGCPCSLITGEERFLVEGADHQASTVEMLDLKRQYDTAVIDEAQMIGDRDRGGAWTAAIMGVRASRIHVCAAPEAEERLIQIIRDCGDTYEIVRHRRLTPIAVEEKAFRFPEDVRPGDALIVFSRRNVHAAAAELRRRNVACSIIYGALPYDVRYKQADLFAAGKTSVLVATDAIGMGMNLPIRRVVLLERAKFDGRARRPLLEGEIRQIVGRAGRYGIYDTGYAASAAGADRVRRVMEASPLPLTKAVIDFPETLLSVDAPLLELIRKWEEVVPASGWRKESVDRMRALAQETRKLKAPKQLAYDFLTIPFDEKDRTLYAIWLKAFEKEVRGEAQSFCGLADAMTLAAASGPDAIDILEKQHRILDLYYNLARKFQPLETTLELIMEKKRICSERIMKVLETKGFQERRCRICGRSLSWNYPYGLCGKCHDRQRDFYGWD